ncbi:ankyrin repeat domain-containing protein [Arsenicicoccus dermatophilus]|uniref:ankyrin repeat domain-containing protein n=1 Tax=Arsenicicoccus dermatophilus TaxID=1076331 RepID=UPI001F4C920C|nr:ankyrin repeat domain-containing protein [Arsenicicoccus dermatophilus]MCH8611812.1 ankyrin repeat domain-containing protein [Arsenicicoccus dermatophilus]
MTSLTDEELAFLHEVFEAARAGRVDLVVPLLDQGLTPNLTNAKGDTLLILAAYHKQRDMVRALLEHGADHARVNDMGQTALGCAVFRQEPQIVADLLAAGADPDAGGRSARSVAEFFRLEEMAALLPPAGGAAPTPEAAVPEDGRES